MGRYDLERINSLEDWAKTMILTAYENDEMILDTNGMLVPKWRELLERFYNA